MALEWKIIGTWKSCRRTSRFKKWEKMRCWTHSGWFYHNLTAVYHKFSRYMGSQSSWIITSYIIGTPINSEKNTLRDQKCKTELKNKAAYSLSIKRIPNYYRYNGKRYKWISTSHYQEGHIYHPSPSGNPVVTGYPLRKDIKVHALWSIRMTPLDHSETMAHGSSVIAPFSSSLIKPTEPCSGWA